MTSHLSPARKTRNAAWLELSETYGSKPAGRARVALCAHISVELLGADESFARYAAGADTEHLDDALYWRAASLRLANDERRAAAAKAYLDRMASSKYVSEVRGWFRRD